MMPSRQQSRRGFTLVEAIAAMTIIIVLGSLASMVIYTGIQANRDSGVRAQVHEEVSTGLEALTSAVRAIPAAAGPRPDISSATPTSLAWAGGGAIALTGTTLHLTPPGGTAAELVRNVSGFLITCYDSTNTVLPANLSGAACEAIQRVEFTITVTRAGVSETLRTRVFIRSLMVGSSS